MVCMEIISEDSECLRILHVIEILSAYSGVNQVPETVLSNFDGF